jgi:hypothetical protein
MNLTPQAEGLRASVAGLMQTIEGVVSPEAAFAPSRSIVLFTSGPWQGLQLLRPAARARSTPANCRAR